MPGFWQGYKQQHLDSRDPASLGLLLQQIAASMFVIMPTSVTLMAASRSTWLSIIASLA
jgi:hypothetical protein